jgi:hypothetical protein
MVIIDEKALQPPPPPYNSTSIPPPFPHRRQTCTFNNLPSHILLKIVYLTFPQFPTFDEGRLERQRKTLYWLSVALRLVNRPFYVACMHVLRSTYLPAYDSLIRPPYSSDPFPLESTSSGYTLLQSVQRETQVLDLFIAVKVREDVWMDDSVLHNEREESFKDLFDHSQPRSRLEDLIRVYGGREGLISYPSPTSSASGSSPSSSSPRSGSGSSRFSTPNNRGITPIPFSSISASFSPRKVGLVLTSQGRKRTIVEVSRDRNDKLEISAKKLVRELRVWLTGY